MNRGLKMSNCRGHRVELNRGRRGRNDSLLHSFASVLKAIELGEGTRL